MTILRTNEDGRWARVEDKQGWTWYVFAYPRGKGRPGYRVCLKTSRLRHRRTFVVPSLSDIRCLLKRLENYKGPRQEEATT